MWLGWGYYLIDRRFRRHQADGHSDDQAHQSHDAIVVEEVDILDNRRSLVLQSTGWGRVDDVQDHPNYTQNNPDGETPKGALRDQGKVRSRKLNCQRR